MPEQTMGSTIAEAGDERMTVYYADENGAIQEIRVEKPAWGSATKGQVIFGIWKQHSNFSPEIELLGFNTLYNDGIYHNEEGGQVRVATYTYVLTLSDGAKAVLEGLETFEALMQSLVLTFAHTSSSPDNVLVHVMADEQTIYRNGIA